MRRKGSVDEIISINSVLRDTNYVFGDLAAIPTPEPPETKIIHINLSDKLHRIIFIEDAIDLKNNLHDHEDHILIFQNLPSEDITQIRIAFNLHPVIDSECSSVENNNRDNLMLFSDHFFFSINDLNASNNVEFPIAMKTIVYSNFLLIFCNEPLENAEDVLSMNLSNVDKADEISDSPRIGFCSEYIEIIFQKLIETIFKRMEMIVYSMEEEARICLRFSQNLSIEEQTDFLLRISMAKRKLIYLRNLVKPKIQLFTGLYRSDHVSAHFKHVLRSLQQKTISYYKRLDKSSSLLLSAETIYTGIADDERTKTSIKLNSIMNFFTFIAVIFIPLNFTVTAFGMNVAVPFQDESDLWPFYVIMGSSILFVLLSLIIMKIKPFLS
ncbi:unnamed protein product [Blepharisma stoltei]|uniref:Magnesium transporter n=1 Tax=Blepharisma stoltei TaxID=1481888 RepID=A0AAU9J5I2_9CILI|nr:unnamed protein product [Blepharisma stoltei]